MVVLHIGPITLQFRKEACLERHLSHEQAIFVDPCPAVPCLGPGDCQMMPGPIPHDEVRSVALIESAHAAHIVRIRPQIQELQQWMSIVTTLNG